MAAVAWFLIAGSLALKAQPVWQVAKSCSFENKQNSQCDITNGPNLGMIEHVAIVCDTTVKILAASVESRLQGVVAGSHGVPLTNVSSQAAGDLKLIVKPQSVIRFALLQWDGPNKVTCRFTGILRELK